MSKFISGKDLLTRLDILPFELFNHVKNGLQPFDKYGKPISPPDIQSTIKQIEVLKNERESFNRRFRWLTGEVSAEEKFKIIDRNVRYYSNEIEEEKKLRPRRETLNKDIDYLEKELKQREDKFSWRNYDLPKDERSAQFVINSLLESYFSIEKIASNKTNNRKAFISGEELLERWPNTDEGNLLELLKKGYSSAANMFPSMNTKEYYFRAYHPSHELIKINFLELHPNSQEIPTKIKEDQVPFVVDYPQDLFPYLKRCVYLLEQIEKVENIFNALKAEQENTSENEADVLIKDLTVKYINSNTVSLTFKGKNSQNLTANEMGFRETAKTWKMFIDVLQSKSHEYHVGTYDINKRSFNIRNYNNEVKNISLFSKKFVSFLNRQYFLSLPIGFNVFKNMNRLGVSRAGTYKPKFKVEDHKIVKIETAKHKDKNKYQNEIIHEEIMDQFKDFNDPSFNL